MWVASCASWAFQCLLGNRVELLHLIVFGWHVVRRRIVVEIVDELLCWSVLTATAIGGCNCYVG